MAQNLDRSCEACIQGWLTRTLLEEALRETPCVNKRASCERACPRSPGVAGSGVWWRAGERAARPRRWVELRHKHFGFASQRVAQLLDEFRAKNRTAATYKGGADGGALDMRAMRGLVASLPQYRCRPRMGALERPARHARRESGRLACSRSDRAPCKGGADMAPGDAGCARHGRTLAAQAPLPARTTAPGSTSCQLHRKRSQCVCHQEAGQFAGPSRRAGEPRHAHGSRRRRRVCGRHAAPARAEGAPGNIIFFVRQSKQRESSLFSMLSGRRARSEQLGRLAVHVEIASRINKAIEERALVALGKLEQDLVFGDATSKEVIAFLAGHGATPAQEKARAALPPPAALRRGGMDRAHPVPPHPAASDAPAPRRRAASPVSASEAAGEAGRGVVCPCLPCRSAAASRRPQPAPPARPK